MRIAFKEYDIRKICEDFSYSEDKFGSVLAQQLMLNLADLDAAPTIGDLPPQNGIKILNEKTSFCVVKLVDNLHLIFRADHAKTAPLNENQLIDWPNVNYIQILEINQINE